MQTLVLALGNPLRGDDGAGAAVLEALQACALPPDVSLIDGGTAGLETVLLLQDCDRALIIDAAEMGLAPGTWRCFTPASVRMASGNLAQRVTVHYAGLAEALALGEALNILPPHILIFGIQAADIGWVPGLSAPVAAAIPAVGDAVLAALWASEPWETRHDLSYFDY